MLAACPTPIPARKDTCRIVLSFVCNRGCPYCCNRQPRIQEQFTRRSLDEIDWNAYDTFCITGGEPLLSPDRIAAVCRRIPPPALVVLYTNGTLLDCWKARLLAAWGVRALNVGLHDPETFPALIQSIMAAVAATALKPRFHAQKQYEYLARLYPDLSFRFWEMDDCDRANEDRFLLAYASCESTKEAEPPEGGSARGGNDSSKLVNRAAT